ncbi:hypothetical protein TNCV_523641 [Trichonephila clavipes]|nr:hypothetical protein TNCV_523641 [Trichonephila clavipes]
MKTIHNHRGWRGKGCGHPFFLPSDVHFRAVGCGGAITVLSFGEEDPCKIYFECTSSACFYFRIVCYDEVKKKFDRLDGLLDITGMMFGERTIQVLETTLRLGSLMICDVLLLIIQRHQLLI